MAAAAEAETPIGAAPTQISSGADAICTCAVCLGLLCDPLTLPCGHNFCRNCLVAALERSQKRCPVCRAACSPGFNAEAAPVNVTLKNLIQALFPAQYAARLAEAVAERRDWEAKVPLFCMAGTFFPGQPINLHLFEPRYRIMMERIMSAGKGGRRRFGHVGSYRPGVGVVGIISEIERFAALPTGTFMVAATAGRRFRATEVWCEDGTAGLYSARVELLTDDEEPAVETICRAAREQLRQRRAARAAARLAAGAAALAAEAASSATAGASGAAAVAARGRDPRRALPAAAPAAGAGSMAEDESHHDDDDGRHGGHHVAVAADEDDIWAGDGAGAAVGGASAAGTHNSSSTGLAAAQSASHPAGSDDCDGDDDDYGLAVEGVHPDHMHPSPLRIVEAAMRLGPEIHLEAEGQAASTAAAAAAGSSPAASAGMAVDSSAAGGAGSAAAPSAATSTTPTSAAGAGAGTGGAGAAPVARTAADPTWRAACRAHALGTAVWRNYAVLRLLALLLMADMHPQEEAELIAHCGPPPLHGLHCGEHCTASASGGNSSSSSSSGVTSSGSGRDLGMTTAAAAGGAGASASASASANASAGAGGGGGGAKCAGRCHTAASVTALSFWLSSILPLPPAVESRLLETTSLGERLWMLLQALWPRYGEELGFPADGDAAASYVECGDEAPAVHARLAAVEKSIPSRRAARLAAFAEAAAAERRRRAAEAEAAAFREEERWLSELSAWLAAEAARVAMQTDPTARAAGAAALAHVHSEHAARVASLRTRQAAAAAAAGFAVGAERIGIVGDNRSGSGSAAPAAGMGMGYSTSVPGMSGGPSMPSAHPSAPVPPGLPFWIDPATLSIAAAAGGGGVPLSGP